MSKCSERESSIELLKIIAVLGIVLSHSMPVEDMSKVGAVSIDMATTDMKILLMVIFRNLGQIGNDIFLIASSWFLIDSRKVSSYKIIHMIGDCFIISMIWLAVIEWGGVILSWEVLFRQFFPVVYSNNWYITCYLLLYLMHPLLNLLMCQLDKTTFLRMTVAFVFLYCGVRALFGLVWGGVLFYNSLIGMTGIYFMTGYMKLHLKETVSSVCFNRKMLIFGIVLWIGSLFLKNFFGLHTRLFSNRLAYNNDMLNIGFFLTACSLFHLFRQRHWCSEWINKLSGLSLLIYIIHENYLFKNYVRYDLFYMLENVYSIENIIVRIFIVFFLNLFFCVIVAMLYKKTLGRIVSGCCSYIDIGMIKMLEKIIRYFNKFN